MSQASTTPTAPARVPDGWWTGHPRYRTYVLFTGTGLILVPVCVVLLFGLRALARGYAAWEAYLEALASPLGVVLMVLLLVGTLFFSFRWLRVGAKIPAVRVGPVPAPSVPLVLIGHFAGLFTITALLLLILGGVIL